MLKLPLTPRPGLLVADDDADPARHFACSDRPRIARRADGSPRVRLTRFMLPDGHTTADGTRTASRLVLDAVIDPSAASLAAAGLVGAAPLPWLDAELELRGPQFDPVVAAASIVDGHAGIGVELPQATAAIVAGLLRAPSSASLQLVWRGHVRARLPAVEVSASVDLTRLQHREVTPLLGRGRMPAGIRVVLQSLVTANARIDIRGGGGQHDDAIEEVLRAWAIDALMEQVERGGAAVVHATAADVVVLPIELVGVIDDELRDDERAGLVEELVLEADELGGGGGRTWVRTLGELGEGVARVDVELDDAGAVQRVALTDDRAQRVVIAHERLRWRARVVPRTGGERPWSAWVEAAIGGDVVVPAVMPAARTLELAVAGFDFAERWRDVHVQIQPPVGAAVGVELDAQTPTAIVRLAEVQGGAPLGLRVECRARSGFVHAQQLDAITDAQVVIADPYTGGGRRLALVPTGAGWADVAQGMVDLRLREGDREFRETVELSRLDGFVQWRAPTTATAPTVVSWRRHTSFRDGRFESTPWADTDLDVLPVAIAGTPSRTVQLLPIHLETGMTLRVLLHSGDIERALQGTDRTPLVAELPPGPYRMALTWTMPDGSTRTLAEQQLDDDAVVIPRPLLPPA